MSIPIAQMHKFYEQLGRPSGEKMQYLLANGDLLAQMVDADLSQVDRKAFSELLFPPQVEDPWKKVDTYVDRIMKRSEACDWGLTSAHADELEEQLHDHAGPLQPTGVDIQLGRGLDYEWAQGTRWLQEELKKLGYAFNSEVAGRKTHFSPHHQRSEEPYLGAVDLDLEKFWVRTDNNVFADGRKEGDNWPSTHVLWLLALNPEVLVRSDGITIPFLLAAGVVVGSVGMPFFGRIDNEMYAATKSGNNAKALVGASVVAFRE